MHAIVSREVISPLLKSASLIAKKNDSRPILRNVLLQAEAGGLVVAATDAAINLRFFIPAGDNVSISEEGSVVTSAENAYRAVNEMHGDKLEISSSDTRCKIVGGGAKCSLVVEDFRDYPNVARFSQSDPLVRVRTKAFRAVMLRTAYCAHSERSFYLMHGIHLKLVDGRLQVAATDGRRLAVCSCLVDGAAGEVTEITVPADAVDAMLKVLGDTDDPIDIQWLKKSFNVRGPKGEASVLALHGNFPDYSRGIPTNTKKITFVRQELVETLRQAQILKSSNTSLVSMDIGAGKVTFKAADPSLGELEIEHVVEWAGVPMSLVVSPEFMLQTAAISTGKQIDFEFEDPMIQTLLREHRSDDVSSFCVYAVARL